MNRVFTKSEERNKARKEKLSNRGEKWKEIEKKETETKLEGKRQKKGQRRKEMKRRG